MPCDDYSRADDCPPSANERCSHEAWEENSGWCRCTDCGYGWSLTEPKIPAGSSPDDRCKCGLRREEHDKIVSTAFHDFAPAEPEKPAWSGEFFVEPEAPECRYPGGCPLEADVCPAGTSCAFDAQLQDVRLMPRPKGEPRRRPPYAVAYAIEGGIEYEIALPGDATVRAVDGALVITHAGAVLALTQARPMES